MDRLADLRRDYKRARLEPEDLGPDPIAAFERWFSEARASEAIEPNAMALGTADEAGTPSVRMVLLKGIDARGFVFYTAGARRGASSPSTRGPRSFFGGPSWSVRCGSPGR